MTPTLQLHPPTRQVSYLPSFLSCVFLWISLITWPHLSLPPPPPSTPPSGIHSNQIPAKSLAFPLVSALLCFVCSLANKMPMNVLNMTNIKPTLHPLIISICKYINKINNTEEIIVFENLLLCMLVHLFTVFNSSLLLVVFFVYFLHWTFLFSQAVTPYSNCLFYPVTEGKSALDCLGQQLETGQYI